MLGRARRAIGSLLVRAGGRLLDIDLENQEAVTSHLEQIPDDDLVIDGDHGAPTVAISDRAWKMIREGANAKPRIVREETKPNAPLLGSARDRMMRARRAAGME